MAEHVELLGSVNETENRVAPLLAVCIPTHNRREALEECLKSVLPQADALGVGVCVSDNCSSDGTWQALETLKHQYPWMQIIRHTRNIGYRGNTIGAVLSCRAQYVWPIGDKWVLLPGALEFLVAELVRLHPDAVVVNGSFDSDTKGLGDKARLHPDAVVVNRPIVSVSIVEKIYSAPQFCLTELAWYTALLGAAILPRQAWVDMLHVQPPSRDFPQVVAFFVHLATLSAPQVLFLGRVFFQVGKSVTENHTASSWRADRPLETWGRNWQDAVMSLPAPYSTNDKLQAVGSCSEHWGACCLSELMQLRVQGELTLQRLYAEQTPLRAAISVPWWSAVVISVAPRWMLRALMRASLRVHPRRMLRAIRSRLRLPRGQHANRSAQ